MRVARLYSFNDIRIEDVLLPKVGPYDALIKTGACGICSGDVMPWYIEKKAPLVLGHEPAGEIVELGSELSAISIKTGDRVFVHHHAPCMDCRYCKRGDYVQCATWGSSRIIPGGISEYILIPEINLRNDTLVLPDNMSYEDATLVEPVACVVKSFKRAAVKKGDTVLILGLGVMGQLHIQLAREFGVEKVIGVDMIKFRLNRALEAGADHVIDLTNEDLLRRAGELTGGVMADIVIVGPNSVEVMKQGLKAVAKGGTVVLFTPAKPDELLTINPNEIYFRDINLVTSYSCGPEDTREALNLIKEGVVRPDRIITHRFPIEKTAEAFQLTFRAGDSLKSIINFG